MLAVDNRNFADNDSQRIIGAGDLARAACELTSQHMNLLFPGRYISALRVLVSFILHNTLLAIPHIAVFKESKFPAKVHG